MSTIFESIDALPPLPKTIFELEQFQKKANKHPKDLTLIIQKDPLISATLLKIANSAMFGLRSKVESIQQAVFLLGIDLTLSIAFGSSTKELIGSNLDIYGVRQENFLLLSTLGATFLQEWLKDQDAQLAQKLFVPSFLQNTGMYIIAQSVEKMDQEDEFSQALKECKDQARVEREITGLSSSEVTAMLFEKWGLSRYFIDLIGPVDTIGQKDTNIDQYQSALLGVAKDVCNVCFAFDEELIQKARKLAKKYELYDQKLEKTISSMKQKWIEREEEK